MDWDKYNGFSDLEKEKIRELWREYYHFQNGYLSDSCPNPSKLITKLQNYDEVFKDELEVLAESKKCWETFEKLKNKDNFNQ